MSIVSPSLMAEDMVVLTQIGNGATFSRFFENIETSRSTIVHKNSHFSSFISQLLQCASCHHNLAMG
jgi:hypothetical protein